MSDPGAQRRWLIGLGITLVFGIFGAVMAVLAYTNSASTPPSRAPAASMPARAPTPAAPSPDQPAAPSPEKPDKPGKHHGPR